MEEAVAAGVQGSSPFLLHSPQHLATGKGIVCAAAAQSTFHGKQGTGYRGYWPLEQCMKLECVPQGQLSSGRVSLPNLKPLVTKQGRGLKALMFEHVSSAL